MMRARQPAVARTVVAERPWVEAARRSSTSVCRPDNGMMRPGLSGGFDEAPCQQLGTKTEEIQVATAIAEAISEGDGVCRRP